MRRPRRHGYSAADERRCGARCRCRPGPGCPVTGAARLRRRLLDLGGAGAVGTWRGRARRGSPTLRGGSRGRCTGRARSSSSSSTGSGGSSSRASRRRRRPSPRRAGARSRRSLPPPPPPPSRRSRRACRPSVHGVVGYRLRVDLDGPDAGGPGEVMNVLRWRTSRGDMRRRLPPPQFQRVAPFGGRGVPAVTRSEFASTGFTAAHLTGARLHGWSVPSALVVNVRRLLGSGERFVYAYYDGLDKVAHEHGLGDHYVQELARGRPVGGRPPGGPASRRGAGGHLRPRTGRGGQRHPASRPRRCSTWSSCSRARAASAGCTSGPDHSTTSWPRRARPTATKRGSGRASRWSTTDGSADRSRPRSPADSGTSPSWPTRRSPSSTPADTGETRLMGRHGSLTSAEMSVPFVAWASDLIADAPAFGGRPPVWEDPGHGQRTRTAPRWRRRRGGALGARRTAVGPGAPGRAHRGRGAVPRSATSPSPSSSPPRSCGSARW